MHDEDDAPPALSAAEVAWVREGMKRDEFWRRAKREAKKIGGWFLGFVAFWIALRSLGIDVPAGVKAFISSQSKPLE